MAHSKMVPGTFIPGVHPKMDPANPRVQLKDKKGRLQWIMPKPVRFAKHAGRRLDRKTKKVVKFDILVPIYRGMSSTLARLFRARARKARRVQVLPMPPTPPTPDNLDILVEELEE